MNKNNDFSKRALVHGAEIPWIASPMKGVERRMLDRVGDEVARATTLVRYAPKSSFSSHTHDLGEEFLVLEGVFQDEHGNFPVGTYVRNPPKSSHTPRSDEGCVILVKLRQFEQSDRTEVVKRPQDVRFDCIADGIERAYLHQDNNESVAFEKWPPNLELTLNAPKGLELFCLEGGASCGGETLKKHSWLRVPAGDEVTLQASKQGARFWIKRGNLLGLGVL